MLKSLERDGDPLKRWWWWGGKTIGRCWWAVSTWCTPNLACEKQSIQFWRGKRQDQVTQSERQMIPIFTHPIIRKMKDEGNWSVSCGQ
jgi:hypothetical protein